MLRGAQRTDLRLPYRVGSCKAWATPVDFLQGLESPKRSWHDPGGIDIYMRKYMTIWILVTCAFCISLFFGTARAMELTQVVKKVQPAVVTVVTYDFNRDISGFGSGFFIDPDGHIITNYHVLDGTYAADIRTLDGKMYPVDAIVGENPASDLIKLRVRVPKPSLHWLQVKTMLPRIAEPIIVVGSPMGLEQTVSEGIVSGIREMPGFGKFFQISAPISQGSSGGPVVDYEGRVVGIVTFMMVLGQNLNFAVSTKGIEMLGSVSPAKTVSEWTYGKSLDQPSVAETLCRKGFEFSVNGQYDRALKFYEEATTKDPTNTLAWHGLGHCYDGLGKPERVVTVYEQAIRIHPEDPELRFELGNYLYKMGRLEDAVGAFENAIRIDPNYADAFSRLAVVQTELKRYAQAVESHMEVIRVQPNSSPAYYNLAVTLSKQNEIEAAIDAYRQAARLDPENIYAFHNMGILQAKMDRPKAAIESHKQVIRIKPDHAPSHLQLGKAYISTGNKPDALSQYAILKELDPGMAEELFTLIYP